MTDDALSTLEANRVSIIFPFHPRVGVLGKLGANVLSASSWAEGVHTDDLKKALTSLNPVFIHSFNRPSPLLCSHWETLSPSIRGSRGQWQSHVMRSWGWPAQRGWPAGHCRAWQVGGRVLTPSWVVQDEDEWSAWWQGSSLVERDGVDPGTEAVEMSVWGEELRAGELGQQDSGLRAGSGIRVRKLHRTLEPRLESPEVPKILGL